MRILQYGDLAFGNLKTACKRVIKFLEEGDFRAAEVKKLTQGPFYRAKLSDSDRLLFRFGKWRGETCLFLLEIIRNHAYESSRFLRGAQVDEARLVPLESSDKVPEADLVSLAYLNPKLSNIHVLDKIISFDDEQAETLVQRPPLILIGSAGSGKTVLTLEKLRMLPGEILYLTHSPFLVDNARSIYSAYNYENEGQEVDFLSFQEYLESIMVPKGRPVTFNDFSQWFSQARGKLPLRDTHALYEEFNGVLTGSNPGQAYLKREEYLSLGQRRSIFPAEQREAIYDLFTRYLTYLPGNGLYDLNIVCHELHKKCEPRYDFLVADEVQDMTAVQLSLALKSLRQRHQFVLCGDANQIVHPNFFSWSNVKSFFYEAHNDSHADIVRILNANYRNAPVVTEAANRLLRIKQARFGSIDRESHYLIKPVSDIKGGVSFLADSAAVRSELNSKTSRSTRYAVIVLREEDKPAVRRSFNTPLIFSVREAKGLEYENIILPGLIGSQPGAFRAIAEGVSESDLQSDFNYSRTSDKSDRSLDIYKFYVNAFYVALTRAIANVYILESDSKHPLLELLKLQVAATVDVAEDRSSEDEWREEALRLERQGKQSQVDDIRRNILKIQPVPWQVLDNQSVEELAEKVFNSDFSNHKAMRLLLDYAATYGLSYIMLDLVEHGFKSASQPALARKTARERQGVDYQGSAREVLRKGDRYGINYRNQLNQTPLMVATQLGLDELITTLIQRGASLTEGDNLGRTPLHYALREGYLEPTYTKRSLAKVYRLVCPPASSARVAGRLVKFDSQRLMFFLFHSMLARFDVLLHEKIADGEVGFKSEDFMAALESFPESVIPLKRRSRTAINAALASNEVQSQAPNNRMLFLRVKRGSYVPNPALELEYNGVWTNIFDLLQLVTLKRDGGRDGAFIDYLEGMSKVKSANGAAEGAAEASPNASGERMVLGNARLPIQVSLTKLVSPYYQGIKKGAGRDTAQVDQVWSLLTKNLVQEDMMCGWLQENPYAGADCLVDYLEYLLEKRVPLSNCDKALHYVARELGLLAEPRAYPLLLKILVAHEKRLDQYYSKIQMGLFGFVIANCCDGNMAELFQPFDDMLENNLNLAMILYPALLIMTLYRGFNKKIVVALTYVLADRFLELPYVNHRQGYFLTLMMQWATDFLASMVREDLLRLNATGLLTRRAVTNKEIEEHARLAEWEVEYNLKETYGEDAFDWLDQFEFGIEWDHEMRRRFGPEIW